MRMPVVLCAALAMGTLSANAKEYVEYEYVTIGGLTCTIALNAGHWESVAILDCPQDETVSADVAASALAEWFWGRGFTIVGMRKIDSLWRFDLNDSTYPRTERPIEPRTL